MTQLQKSCPRHKQKGFIAVTYAVMITGLLGFCGMAVDAGYMQWNKRRVQLAADAAAMGALRELERSNPDSLSAAGINDASLNGFTNGQNATVVEIHNPPISGAYSGDDRAVQAIVRRNFPTMFMRIFGQNNVSIAADAVARTTTTQGTIGACIWALNPTMKNALNISGTTLDIATNCSIVVESSHAEAFTMGGGPILRMGHEARVGVVGGWALLGSSQILDVSHTPPIDRSPEHIVNPGDPFVGLPEPSPVASNPGFVGATNLTVRGTSVAYSKNNKPALNKILPGVYCRGLKISDTDDETFTFMPGVYILYGGGMEVTSNAKIAGTGVTFYSTGARTGGPNWGCAGNASQNAFEPLSITGQGGSTLAAPTEAGNTFKGMLFFTDRNISDNRPNNVVGGSGSYFDGALYFKRTHLKFAGKSSTNGYLILVADQISINGTSQMGNNYTGLQEPNPFAPYTTGGGMVE